MFTLLLKLNENDSLNVEKKLNILFVLFYVNQVKKKKILLLMC